MLSEFLFYFLKAGRDYNIPGEENFTAWFNIASPVLQTDQCQVTQHNTLRSTVSFMLIDLTSIS